MTTTKAVKRACQILRRRVRLKDAVLHFPGSPYCGDDTDKIREATDLYVETWLVPLLDAIERGDARGIDALINPTDQGDKMEG